MIIRIRSRDGLERVTLPDNSPTLSTLSAAIESQLGVPVSSQLLSRDQNLLLSTSSAAADLSSAAPSTSLSSLGLSHGALLFLSYPQNITRSIPGPAAKFTPAGSFGQKMTMDDLIARQIRVTRQENPHCDSASFARDPAHQFQLYVADSLAFAVKRGGFLYGTVNSEHISSVEFIYEPPQQGTEDNLLLLRDPLEESFVDAIAYGLGMRRVGFIFTQAVTRQGKGEWTMSSREVLQAAELHAEGGIDEWVTAIVKLEVNEDGAADVHFEAFQMSDTCVKLFKDGVFESDVGEEENPRVSRMKKEVVVGGKDVKEVDNDFFLVPVKISDHQV